MISGPTGKPFAFRLSSSARRSSTISCSKA
jgi:hypothetical protein